MKQSDSYECGIKVTYRFKAKCKTTVDKKYAYLWNGKTSLERSECKEYTFPISQLCKERDIQSMLKSNRNLEGKIIKTFEYYNN